MPPVAIADDVSTASYSVADGKHPKMKRRHSVDFVGDHTIIEYDAVDHELREEVWYNKDEYDIIKARNSLIVKMMKTGNFEENGENCFRGLEHKLKEGFKQRRSNKFNALNAVLEEQDRQYNRGLSQPEIVAESYRRVSLGAKEAAYDLACRDAEESYCFDGKPVKRLSLTEALSEHEEEEDEHEELEIDTDADTVCSEGSKKGKTRLRSLFGGVSRKRKEKNRLGRRESL